MKVGTRLLCKIRRCCIMNYLNAVISKATEARAFITDGTQNSIQKLPYPGYEINVESLL